MKNLLLVFALVSLFSCKKETVTLIENEVVEQSNDFKSYVCLVSQYGNNDPEVAVLSDDFLTLNWKRSSYGAYDLISEGSFKKNKVFVVSSGIYYEIAGEDRVVFKTYSENGTPKDGLLYNTPIEIRVYD